VRTVTPTGRKPRPTAPTRPTRYNPSFRFANGQTLGPRSSQPEGRRPLGAHSTSQEPLCPLFLRRGEEFVSDVPALPRCGLACGRGVGGEEPCRHPHALEGNRARGARVGYALADPETARKLNARQAPAPISTLSAALALAAHAEPTDVRPLLEERERLAASLRDLGLEPLPSATNFLYVPFERAPELSEVLLGEGMVVRAFPDAIRVTVLDPASNERLLAAVGGSLDRFV
jgi:hypothetical protein